MLSLASSALFARRSLSSLAKTVHFGAAFVPALLLPLAAANAFPLAPSAGCTPSPYSSGDLTCTNAGTVTSSGVDGIDAPANSGTAATINSGTITSTGNVFGIRTITTLGDATTTNSGTVNVSGGPATGILTRATANATTNNSGAVNVSGTGDNIGINTSIGFAPTVEFGVSLSAPSGPGTATTNNSGNVNVAGNFSTGILTSAGTASPGAFPAGIAPAGGSTATTTNSGNVNVTGLGGVGIETTTQVFFTGPATTFSAISGGGDAITTNSGNISVNGTVDTNPPQQAGVLAFGAGGTFGILTAASFGNATTTNSGNVNVTGFNSTGISTTTNSGNATTINSGNISVVGTVNGAPQVCVNNCGGSNTGIATTTFNGNVTVINSGKVSVTGPNNVGISMSASGTSTLVDSGTISAPGGIAILFANPLDPATLTLTQSSFTIGVINLIGAGDTVNVNAVNLNLTFNTLAGVNVAGNVPFVVSGNRIVSVDPTGFGVTDRTLMDFTRAVSGMLGGRASDAAASDAAGTGRALGFAGYDDSASRFDDAFAQVMGYAKAPDNAMVFKNPTMTAPDGTTVWAKGFYGQHIQPADGPAFRTVSNFYGGAIGADRLTRPDLRLGGFVGGGTINTSIDLNLGSTGSDIGFAGFYGRKDFGAAFVDFALLGGRTDNRTTRNINNNLIANGLEIATANFGGWFFSPEVAAGYRYGFAPGWTVTPAARLRYLAANYDGFTETGSTANMTAGSRMLEHAEERAELTLSRTIVGDAGRLQAGLTAGVLGQQRTGSGNVNAILLGQALAFATPGKSSIAGGYAGGSLDWRMRNGLALFAAAEYTAMSDSSNTVTGRAGLRYGF